MLHDPRAPTVVVGIMSVHAMYIALLSLHFYVQRFDLILRKISLTKAKY